MRENWKKKLVFEVPKKPAPTIDELIFVLENASSTFLLGLSRFFSIHYWKEKSVQICIEAQQEVKARKWSQED